jgi:hypothetical protein
MFCFLMIIKHAKIECNLESFDSINESFMFLMNELKDETLLMILVDKHDKMDQNLDFFNWKIFL